MKNKSYTYYHSALSGSDLISLQTTKENKIKENITVGDSVHLHQHSFYLPLQ